MSEICASHFAPPLHFYEVRGSDETLATISQKFKVNPKCIERASADSHPLQPGEMVIINRG